MDRRETEDIERRGRGRKWTGLLEEDIVEGNVVAVL